MKVNYDGHEHEHEFEPEYGLPEPLPAGEHVLWQGAPDWRTLARHVFHVRTLVVYFAVILVIRATVVAMNGGTGAEVIRAVALLSPLAALAVGIAAGMALLCARTTVYTITDKRVAMRIGIVLNLTFNLPLSRIAMADLREIARGTGDIPLALSGSDRIAYAHLWPHARPWRLARPEPMLRCIPDVARVAAILKQAWTQDQFRVASVQAVVPVAAPRHQDLPSAPTTQPTPAVKPAPRTRWFADGQDQRLSQGA